MNYLFKQKIKFAIFSIIAVAFGISIASYSLKYFNPKNISMLGANANLSSEDNLEKKENKELPAYHLVWPEEKPKITAKAYVIGDLDTGEIISGANENTIFPIASVSKVMTARIVREMADDSVETAVSRNAIATEGQNGNLKVGEKLPLKDLLYALLLESSNDASEVLAEHLGRETFINKMNEKSKELGLSNTTFEDPSGLSPNNKSTASELFKLARDTNEKDNEIFIISKQKSYTNESKNHKWFSNNQFLKQEGYLGGKSGYTDLAMQTGVSLFSLPLSTSSPRNIGIALLQSRDRFKDVQNILKFLNKNVFYGLKEDLYASSVTARIDVPPLYEQDFVTLLFGGDMMLDRGVRNSVNKNFAGDYSKLFDNLNILKEADVVFANLEGPASDQGKDMKNLYSFRMDPSILPAMKGAGINVVSVANNHVGDWGREAYIDTLDRLKENEILFTGGGITKSEAERPVIIEKYGIKIGYLAFSDVGPDWMKATEDQPGLLIARDPRFEEIISNASREVDHLIVSFHFGDEYKLIHNERQEELAHRAIDAGAKIVIGHHPHVIQDTEVYKNGFIAYSLGNFIFDQSWSQPTMKGMLLEIKLGRDGSISIKKNISNISNFFQPEKTIIGKEEKIISAQ